MRYPARGTQPVVLRTRALELVDSFSRLDMCNFLGPHFGIRVPHILVKGCGTFLQRAIRGQRRFSQFATPEKRLEIADSASSTTLVPGIFAAGKFLNFGGGGPWPGLRLLQRHFGIRVPHILVKLRPV